jgi:hypothetical protein
MKPIQNHRVVKDKITLSNEKLLPVNGHLNNGLPSHDNSNNNHQLIKKSGLAAISTGRESFSARPEEMVPFNRGSMFSLGLPKIEPNGYNNDRDQVLNLQKRMKDLEKENYRLTHHVQQAEQTLRNYRDCFGALPAELPKPNNNSGNKPTALPTVTVNKENATPSASNEQQNHSLTAQIQLLENKLQDSSQKCLEHQSEKEKTTLQYKELQSQFQQQLDLLKQSNKTNEKHEKTIASLHQTNQQQKEEIIQLRMKHSSPVKTHNSNDEKQKLQTALRTLLLAFQQLKEEFHSVKSIASQEIQSVQSSANQSIESLQEYCSLVLSNSVQSLQKSRNEFLLFKSDHELIVQQLKDRIHSLESQQHGVSPNKKNVPKKGNETAVSPMKSASELDQLQRMNQEYLSKLDHATQAINSLSDLHTAEIKSIKHLAHIRELIRVAKEREQAIDKDRMIIEIKHLK